MLFSDLFEWFITKFWTASSLYGPFASIFLIALWLKTIITILFLGACLNEARFQMSETTEQAESGPPASGEGQAEPG